MQFYMIIAMMLNEFKKKLVVHPIKEFEGVLQKKNVSPSLGLCDHFPDCGILNYTSDRDRSLMVCLF